MTDSIRFGSPFCFVDGTPNEIFKYRVSHEQYCNAALRELVPIRPMPLKCRIGLHSMFQKSRYDGGGHTFSWGYCTRCHRAYTEGWNEILNTFDSRTGAHPGKEKANGGG